MLQAFANFISPASSVMVSCSRSPLFWETAAAVLVVIISAGSDTARVSAAITESIFCVFFIFLVLRFVHYVVDVLVGAYCARLS